MARKTSKSSNVAELANKALATRLRELVTDTSALAKYLDCSLQAVNQYKQGTSQPKIENIIKIADFYNVSVDYLFGITETKNRDTTTQAICQATGLSEKAVENISLFQKQFESRKVAAFKEDAKSLLIAQNEFISSPYYGEFVSIFEKFLEVETDIAQKRKYIEQNFDTQKLEAYRKMETQFSPEEEEELLSQWQFVEAANQLQEDKNYRTYLLIEGFKKIIQKTVEETEKRIKEG